MRAPSASARLTLAAACASACLLATTALAVQPSLRVYDDQVGLTPLDQVHAGIRLAETPVSALTADHSATAATMEQASSWDFRPAAALPGGTDAISQSVPLTSAWTCYLPDTTSCGFAWAGNDGLAVTDTVEMGMPKRAVSAYEYDAARGLVLGRATVIDEGGTGEIRSCFNPALARPEVPVIAFPHVDGARRYLALGDAAWASQVFNCVAGTTQGGPCGTAGTNARLTSGNGTLGRFNTRIVKTGTVTLPSGHVLDAMLLETLTSYDVRADLLGSCGPSAAQVNQYRLSWLVPGLGSMASITSEANLPNLTSFTTASATNLGFGLLPPLSVGADTVAIHEATVTWNPGAITRFIDGYEVHWGTQSGRVLAPPSSSGVLPASQTTYTITGLDPSTTYYVSVTSRKTYTDPVSHVATTYHSVELPATLGADVDGDGVQEVTYPPETTLTTLAAGACVAGDISPAAGDERVTLGDFVAARRRLVNQIPNSERFVRCGDVDGTPLCQPANVPAHWCITGNGTFGVTDAIAIRRKVARLIQFSCAACRGAEPAGTLGDDSRRPGDLAPRGGTDAQVNISDVVLELRLSVGLDTPTPEEQLRGDVAPGTRVSLPCEPPGTGGTCSYVEVTGDRSIDISDVVLMLRASVGLDRVVWPRRRVAVHYADALPYGGFTTLVTGWPTAADVVGYEAPDCDPSTTLEAGAGGWSLLCLTNAPRSGPEDLASYVYRAPAPLDPSTLTISNLEVDDPAYVPYVAPNVSLTAP